MVNDAHEIRLAKARSKLQGGRPLRGIFGRLHHQAFPFVIGSAGTQRRPKGDLLLPVVGSVHLMAEKRRLPVLNATKAPPKAAPEDADDAPEVRPGWHWVGFGAVAVFGAWLPLAYLSQWIVSGFLTRRMGRAAAPDEVAAWLASLSQSERTTVILWTIVPHAVALALASVAGGYVVGRYAPKDIGVRGGASAGLGAGLVAVVLSISASGFSPALLVVLLLTTAFAAAGARLGLKKRGPVVGA